MTRDARAIVADIDSFDPDRFVAHLTEDVVFRFGNGEPAIGRAAVREAVAGFFSDITTAGMFATGIGLEPAGPAEEGVARDARHIRPAHQPVTPHRAVASVL